MDKIKWLDTAKKRKSQHIEIYRDRNINFHGKFHSNLTSSHRDVSAENRKPNGLFSVARKVGKPWFYNELSFRTKKKKTFVFWQYLKERCTFRRIILFTGKCQLVHSKGVPLYFHLSRQTTWCHLAEPQSQAVMSLYFAEETCHFKWMIDGAFLHSNKNELWALDWTNHLLSFHLIFAFNFQTRSYWKF